jgi:hypothetical protein
MTRPVHPTVVVQQTLTKVQRDIANILKPKLYKNDWDND